MLLVDIYYCYFFLIIVIILSVCGWLFKFKYIYLHVKKQFENLIKYSQFILIELLIFE